jgi:hypothetical protein
MAAIVPDPARRLGIGAALVLVPASSEVFGTLSHIQWILGAFLIAYAGATRGRRWELLVLGVAAFTGPVAIFALPLYAVRWWRDRWFWPALAVVAGAAALQLVVFAATSPSYPHPPVDAAAAAASFVEHITRLPWFVGIFVFVLAAAVARPRRLVALLGLIGIAIAAAGMLRLGVTSVWENTRYFWLAGWLLLAVIVAAPPSLGRRIALAATFGIVLITFKLPVQTRMDTAALDACVSSSKPCSVALVPGVDDAAWILRWPGR